MMEVRHFWRKSRRIAEIRVPAWPMPTQNTKFVMSNAQPTVRLRPQTPMPVTKRYAIEATPTPSMVTATIASGKVLMKNRKLLFLDEAEITAKSRELAAKCWKRYGR